MHVNIARLLATVIVVASGASHAAAAPPRQDALAAAVSNTIAPLMSKYALPGMAVGIVDGDRTYFFNYGLASIAAKTPVTKATLFELGSISKTFTATLASSAQQQGFLSLADPVEKFVPELAGTPFGAVPLLHLGTHTPGGLPLQVPDQVGDNAQLMQYFKDWKPTYAAGTRRTYANPGIGMLGVITAKSMNQDFTALMEQRLFPALGLRQTFIDVPAANMPDYAQGYNKTGAPVRVSPGVLAAEAYGVKSSSTDMVRFLQANMRLVPLEAKLQRAVSDTHIAYFQAGVMTQDLIWEQFSYPVTLETLVAGNSAQLTYDANPVTPIAPQPPRDDVWINKTGSTNGFGAYVAFIPQQKRGIVMLANKSYPNDQRATAAYRILSALAELDGAKPAAGK